MSSCRYFGAKGKPAGGPPAPEYKEPPRVGTNFEALIEEKGVDAFLFGPPKGIEKMQNPVHRDYIIPKLASGMEFFAKKMREQYIREGIYPDVKIFLDPVRERQPDDTLQKLHG